MDDQIFKALVKMQTQDLAREALGGMDKVERGDKGHKGDKVQPPHMVSRKGVKGGRNKPCPCGSGEKYKRCHGREEE